MNVRSNPLFGRNTFLAIAIAGAVYGCSDSTSPPPLGPTDPEPNSPDLSQLEVGATRTLKFADIQSGIVVPEELSGAEYIFAVANVDTAVDGSAVFGVRGQGIREGGAQSAQVDKFAFEAKLRESEKRVVGVPGSASRSRIRANLLAKSGGVRRVDVPVVNEKLDIRVGLECNSFTSTVGTVKAVGTKAVIVIDDESPGSFSSAEYSAIAAEFDTLIYPTIASYFGVPTDIDDNGRIIIYFTPQVNRMTDPGTANQGYVGGYFYGVDYAPRSPLPSNPTSPYCTKSNEAEIFYVITPDPTGVFGNVFQTSVVRESIRGTIAHEFQHMINFGTRLFNINAMWEEPWLDEGLAHIAEDAAGRVASRLSDMTKITMSHITNQTISTSVFSGFFYQNFARFREYLKDPTDVSMFDDDPTIESRGASWAFLRYILDWHSSGSPRTLTRALVANPQSGVDNLVASTGKSFETLFGQWLLTVYADGMPIENVGTHYSYGSYDLRNILSAGPPLWSSTGYPLPITTINQTITPGITTYAGAAKYYRSAPTSGAARNIKVYDGGGAVSTNPNGRVYIMRVR